MKEKYYYRKNFYKKNTLPLNWQGRDEAIHEDKVAGTSKHNEYVEDFV